MQQLYAQIAQIEQFKTAVNTFRTKYNGLPGDLKTTDATAFGFVQRAGTSGHGDGNGILESCGPSSTYSSNYYFGCETALFWRDLSDAGLIAGNFTGDADSLIAMNDGQQEQYIPAAKIGNHNFIAVFGFGGIIANPPNEGGNIWLSGETIAYALVQDVTSDSSGSYNFTNSAFGGLTSTQAFAIDTKMDDGMPTTGKVFGSASSGILSGINQAMFPNICTYSNDGITYYYYVSSTYVDYPQCIMNFW